MPIVFACTGCGTGQRAADHLIGRTFRCQNCGTPMTVPATSSAVMPTPPSPPPKPVGDDDIFFDQIRKTSKRSANK